MPFSLCVTEVLAYKFQNILVTDLIKPRMVLEQFENPRVGGSNSTPGTIFAKILSHTLKRCAFIPHYLLVSAKTARWRLGFFIHSSI